VTLTPLKISLFVEDDGHRLIVGPLVNRVALEENVVILTNIVSAIGGRGRVFEELRQAKKDIDRGNLINPDVFVVAIDSNCSGFLPIRNDIAGVLGNELSASSVSAVPDPHIERWLLVDSAAFKLAVGLGCNAPDQKCERGRYKKLLSDAIRAAGLRPNLGGLEFAEDIIGAMDLQRACAADAALNRFVGDLRSAFRVAAALSQ
jgi:hypothetical protein